MFIFAGDIDHIPQSSVQSEKDSSVYGKSPIYEYLVEPLISLDDKWGHIVTHCSIVGEDLSQVIQTYDGFGSCVFEQTEFLSSEEISKENIIFHIKLENQLFELLFQWEGLSLQSILSSYLENNPHKLSSQITLDLFDDEKSLSDVLSYLILSEMFKISSPEGERAFQKASEFLLQKTIDVIRLVFSPYAEGLLKVTLSFLDSYDVEFYELEAITNYYAGADEYFFTSIDQYQREMNEE